MKSALLEDITADGDYIVLGACAILLCCAAALVASCLLIGQVRRTSSSGVTDLTQELEHLHKLRKIQEERRSQKREALENELNELKQFSSDVKTQVDMLAKLASQRRTKKDR
ncbi:hypothetical protein THAOC_16974 [Thalassiosira oceanica]|uniref:Uncharacterized protein n=1 Tax=Thalassiosira oceanica TaxID=159749 RepID=K0SVY0_THAOC|nr:hypothetical protein THAOC_16974 [Thalassiosira oceanica]|mmetsp:Transcript_34361/g.82170  ORF Transcript_34361/g.82170 Transcript_34361/m.82170 type:complete len:112 (+) Transcript_34361:47-382(+)|eukprot:EJK62417.1 hypothetical protein THAOC_16974 [Thalassiosira oceanica]